jgi:hypothetical protein
MSPHRFTIAAAILAALAAMTPGHADEPGDEALSVTRTGRIAVCLDGSGYFKEIESGRLKLGMRWPGAAGTEFLGGGGLLMRFVAGDENRVVYLGPGDFESALPGPGVACAAEGCRCGTRYPADGCDDDGDGVFDEDPLDGRDNDGDGEIDEDFAAVGDGMYVTSALASDYGIRVTRRHHIWNYGHVRDFIGFSTTIEYLPPEGQGEALRQFELIHYMDFEIGDRDDAGRGRDDRIVFLQSCPDESGEAAHVVATVTDERGERPIAAVVIFRASMPDGALAVGAEGRNRQRRLDSLWEEGKGACRVLGGEWAPLDTEEAELLPGIGSGNIALVEAAAGDVVLAHRFGPARDIYPGESVELEWAIVFGKDYAALMRNISRARETWEGLALPEGGMLRWVVPARKAIRISADAALAPVWVQGEKRPAVSVDLPAIEGEEIEWLKVAGTQTGDFETVGDRIVIALGEKAASSGPFTVEGQLTDGTIFSSYIGEEELQRFAGEEELQPDRLPEDSIRLFPNPFVGDLTIGVLVQEPSVYMQGRSSAAQPGIGSVRVYDVKGRLVRIVLTDEVLHPGEHTLGWDGKDEAGTKVSPGVYYCRLQIGDRSLTRRVILLR